MADSRRFRAAENSLADGDPVRSDAVTRLLIDVDHLGISMER